MKNPFKSLYNRVFYGWWIVAFGATIISVGGGILYHGFTIFFLPLTRDLGVSRAAISLLYGAARLEGGVEGPIVGHLIDRFGPRAIIIGGIFLSGIGMILLATVESFWTFFFIYVFIVSLGYNAGFFHPVYAAVNTWFIRRRGLAFSIVSGSGNIGGIIMAPLLAYLILNFGWRTGAVISGLIILLIGIPCALPLYRSPEVLGLKPDGGPSTAPSANDATSPAPILSKPEQDFTVREALRTPTYWVLTSGIAMRLFVTVALSVHFVPILVWKGMDEATAAYLVSLFAFTSIFSALAMGWMGDRGSKVLISSYGIMPLMIALILVVWSQDPWAAYALPIGLAITMGTPPLNWALIGDFFGRRSYATLRGIMGIFYGFSTFFSPIFAGWIFDGTGSYTIVLLTFVAVLIVSFVLFLLLPQPSQLRKKTNKTPS